ncbi:hypothetical protein ACFQ8T_04485 [Isoptericola sp. NPDC056618]|uniref:hypothetical protein n=1 Tax=Isoptericola sp. NPDC056618 TaxID=3345878 RepID=UPI0036B32556
MTIHTGPEAAAVKRGGEPMLLGHYLTYQVARSNLCALADATETGRLHDYWDVLDVIDFLHPPDQLAVALPVRGVSRYAMYVAARRAIEDLGRYGLDPVNLLEARHLLDAAWAEDPGAVRAAP